MNTEILKLLSNRQSVREYSEKAVEPEKLLRCIEAARVAPSACNAQPWKFIVVDDPVLKNKVADFTSDKILKMNHFTKQAPILVIVVREKANLTSNMGQLIKNKEYPLIDIGIATIQFCIQATAEGLGTCIMGWFRERKLKTLLNIPKSRKIELIISLGYPKSDYIREKKRKNLNEILSFNGYKIT